MFQNEFWAKVTQYTYTKDNRPLKIEQIIYASGVEEWVVVDFGFVIGRYKTAKEVKDFLGARPVLRGAYEIYHTPVGRSIEKSLFGVRVF